MTEILVPTNPEQWGARYKGQLPASSGALVQVLSNPSIAGDAVPIGVHLFKPDRVAPSVSENADARAKITYGSGAAENSFFCDWDAQFSLVCQRITVELQTYPPLSEDVEPYAASATREVIFGALIGRGACPSGGADSLGFTSDGVLVGAASQVVYDIPDFARRYYPVVSKDPVSGGVMPSGAELANMTVALLNQATYQLSVVALSEDILARGLPIPGGIARISFGNANADAFHLIHHFKLGL